MIATNIEPSELVYVPCPRCCFEESSIVYKGKDYLYNIPGEYYVSQCKNCALWFQNPRPSDDQLVHCYPLNYTPHTKPVASVKNYDELKQPEDKYGWSIKSVAKYFRKLILSYHPKNFLYHHLGYKHLPVESEITFNWRLLTIFNWFNRWVNGVFLTPVYVQNGMLLEIGVGSGKRLLELRRIGWQNLYGIELVPTAAKLAQAEGFSVECGSVEGILSHNYPDNFFDVIIASMVLEHLSNPFQIVEQISKKLKPGGQFLFSTITRDSLDAKIYGVYWGGFDFPRHLVHFKKNDILDMLKENYENIECFYQNSPIDFVRSATWRDAGGDRVIKYLASSLMQNVFGMLLVWLKLSSRISFRCHKKS